VHQSRISVLHIRGGRPQETAESAGAPRRAIRWANCEASC
jgi:hypothetical protein